MEDVEKLENLSEKKELPFIEDLSEQTAQGLVQAAWHQAFQLFRNKNFRRLLDFNKMRQVEQDRVFNELTVTVLLLPIFTFEAPDLETPPYGKDYLYYIRDKIPEIHVKELRKLGIEKKHLKIWSKLIDLRYSEYQEKKDEVQSAAWELESQECALDFKGLEDIQLVLPLQTLAIGCFSHITRGKGRAEDPLFPMILRWLGGFYIEIRALAEGRKITFWIRLRMKLRRFLRSLKRIRSRT